MRADGILRIQAVRCQMSSRSPAHKSSKSLWQRNLCESVIILLRVRITHVYMCHVLRPQRSG